MNKAEEIANRCAIKEEWFYKPLIDSINEALEWAAQQCDKAVKSCEEGDDDFDGLGVLESMEIMACLIRDGKSEAPV